MPRVFSRDAHGVERDFLFDWYRSTSEVAANTFRKGYQWPFHASRMLDFGSSLLDLAIHHESRLGRTVLLDFLRNPAEDFRLEILPADARSYLERNQATQALPIDRLRCMNPLAIELYRMHGHDLARDALPFNVNHQHLNGGVAVDGWNRSSLPGLYAIGEVAGTHGVTRPGGAALNAGQVGGMRVAEHVAAHGCPRPDSAPGAAVQALVRSGLAELRGGRMAVAALRDEIQARMSDQAGFICPLAELPAALTAASRLRRQVWDQGIAVTPEHAAEAFRWRHLALLSEAMLTSLDVHVADGGGSRGARAYCGADGEQQPSARAVDCSPWRFRAEQRHQRDEKLVVTWDGAALNCERRMLRQREDLARISFEKDWGRFLAGSVFADGFIHA